MLSNDAVLTEDTIYSWIICRETEMSLVEAVLVYWSDCSRTQHGGTAWDMKGITQCSDSELNQWFRREAATALHSITLEQSSWYHTDWLKWREDQIGGACSTNGTGEKNVTFWSESLKGKDHWKDVGEDEK
jgi:hypothetical protein